MTDTTETADHLPERHHVCFTRAEGEKKPTISVDGVDVAKRITGFQLIADPTGVRVALEVHPRHLGAVEFDGLAVVEINTYSEDPGPAAAMFLAAMDPETVEKHALARLDIENVPGGTTAAIIRTLIEWANGQGTL